MYLEDKDQFKDKYPDYRALFDEVFDHILKLCNVTCTRNSL